MNRRAFLSSACIAAASWCSQKEAVASPANTSRVNKRKRMTQWLAGKTDPDYTPAAFFLHFGPEYRNGLSAARRHMEFFRETDMDFVKIQFEQSYERQHFLQTPADWSKLKLQKVDFYEPLLVTVRELVRSAREDALVLMTLYSPFMSAGQCASEPILHRHLTENPEAVKKGLEILTESQLIFVKACVKAGVDGFYMSTQGSEATRFLNSNIFPTYIKPFDLIAMKEAQSACPFNILHVCDYQLPYASYDAVRDYPGHVVNCNPVLTSRTLPFREISEFFARPVMGGLDRHGLLVKGTAEQMAAEIRRVVKSAPRQFILGADCTVEAATEWKRLHHAISVSHSVGL
jgi:uroporphyrinogen decarboxylase